MDCARVEELLPWLVNGSLLVEEAASVREHLAQCPACREALADTAWVAELSASHLPAGSLVDLAAGIATPGMDRALVEAHLASCAACAAELALVRESWAALAAPESAARVLPDARIEPTRPGLAVAPRPRPTRDWRNLALAATLAGMILGGFGLWQARQQAAADGVRRAAEVERWSREVEESRRARTAAEARLTELQAPQLNASVAELMPAELVLRSASTALPVLSVPAVGRITLLLYAPPKGPAQGDYTVELRDAQGRILWSARGLTRQPVGDFSLSLPAELLPEGAAELRVFPPGEGKTAVAHYRFQVRRGG